MAPGQVGGHLVERPYGLAFSVGSTMWSGQDVPMLLATFERVARKVLNAWIDSLGTGGVAGA
jgi:hypothetical protein